MIVTQLNEAEIAGDDDAVRRLLALLRDRHKIPAKVFVFSEDARPGYYGTWTRNSREVGPRTPFARDVVAVDYSYDSGEEWEEEEQGDADNVDDDDEDEGGATEEVDSDLDDWLVDDDEVEPGTPIEERPGSPDFFDFNMPQAPPKRKRDPEASSVKKRKVVVPLVPFNKGPCWESVIGECEYEPFKGYRIELFNGAHSVAYNLYPSSHRAFLMVAQIRRSLSIPSLSSPCHWRTSSQRRRPKPTTRSRLLALTSLYQTYHHTSPQH